MADPMRVEKSGSNGFQSRMVEETAAFFEAFLKAEIPLFSRTIDGFHYWHFIRFHFFDLMLLAKGWIEKPDRRESVSPIGLARLGLRFLHNSTFSAYHYRWDARSSDVLFLGSTQKLKKNRRTIDPYIDLFLDGFKHAYSIWEPPVLWRHVDRERTPNLFYLDALYIESFLRRGIRTGKSRSLHREIAFLKDFGETFNLVLNLEVVARLLNFVIFYDRYFSGVIRERLSRKRVRLVMLVVHYDSLKMLMTRIAREMGITVVELQHGTLGRYHIAYNFGHQDRLPTLPDEIFTFGRFWNETTRIRDNGVRLTPIGMPLFDDRIREAARLKTSSKTKILIISQEVIAHRLCPVAVELAGQLDPDQYEIWYKLHPREFDCWESKYPEAFHRSGIRIFKNQNIYGLLRASDVHVAVYSTVIIESLVFEKMLILLDMYGVHHFEHLIRTGRAHFARNAGDILRVLNSGESYADRNIDLSYYWETNSRDRLLDRIDELLKERD